MSFWPKSSDDLLHELLAYGGFWLPTKVDFAALVNQRHCIVCAIETNALIRHVIHHNGVQALAQALVARILQNVMGFRRKTDHDVGLPCCNHTGNDVWVFHQR